MEKKIDKSTQVISRHQEKVAAGTPVVNAWIPSTTFLRSESGALVDNQDIYSRASNPNRRLLENKLAIMENGIDSAVFSSGQAATYAIFQSLNPGSHVIIPDDIYYGTRVVLEQLLTHLNFSVVDMTSVSNIVNEVRDTTRLIWIETPSNPKLKITDIKAVVKQFKNSNIILVCDNTWATPFFTNPLQIGADLVMHSTTKYLGGHSDILGGVVIWNEKTDDQLVTKIRNFQILAGAVPSTFDCWLLIRSLMTFYVRMPVHAQNALMLANFLFTNPNIEKVYYPGLISDAGHLSASKQMEGGFGGMLSVLIKGNESNCLRVASKLKIFKHATSLGGVESLVDHRRTAEGEHSVSEPNLLRISVGIESIGDLIEDFRQALA
jgi:cystathionine gamma-synthase